MGVKILSNRIKIPEDIFSEADKVVKKSVRGKTSKRKAKAGLE